MHLFFFEERKAINMIIYINHFKNHGFKVTRDKIVKEFNIDFLFKAYKKSSINFIFRFTDYYFVYKTTKELTLYNVRSIHSLSKSDANKDFSLPKSLRLRVPNINTVIISESLINEEIKEYVGKIRKTALGGEQDSIFILRAVYIEWS